MLAVIREAMLAAAILAEATLAEDMWVGMAAGTVEFLAGIPVESAGTAEDSAAIVEASAMSADTPARLRSVAITERGMAEVWAIMAVSAIMEAVTTRAITG
ncbi:MAG: hypothetical protein GXP27_18375 [Planctomycetes bacterium]|nr:hypothetical protein [Planctomycetota bacterium]